MTNNSRSLVFCLLMVFIPYCQVLQFFMEPVPNGSKCGHMQCWADKLFTDPNIFFIINLSVYDVTQPNTKTKLASLSGFDQLLSLDETKINNVQTTGNISDNHAELTLALRDTNSCLNRSYLCELEFVNVQGHPESIQETVSPRDNEKCISPVVVFNGYAKVAFKIKTHSDVLETEVAQLKHRNQVLETELSKLQGIVNSSHTTPVVKCIKGQVYNHSRETFMLWDKIPALCDTETDGGGWVVIQRRTNGQVDFNRDWADYKNGFGTLDTDFWFGLDNIYTLTSQGYKQLRIDMEYKEKQYFAHYSNFSVANETLNYRLSVSGYTGTAGDNLQYQNGNNFSTYDRDHDAESGNCAVIDHGAWWYNACTFTNLNGLWGAQNSTGVRWDQLTTVSHSLTFSEMKLRRD